MDSSLLKKARLREEGSEDFDRVSQIPVLSDEALSQIQLRKEYSLSLRKNMFLVSRIQSLKQENLDLVQKHNALEQESLKIKKEHENLLTANTHFQQSIKHYNQEAEKIKTCIDLLQKDLKLKKEAEHRLSRLNHHLQNQIREEIQKNRQAQVEIQEHKKQNQIQVKKINTHLRFKKIQGQNICMLRGALKHKEQQSANNTLQLKKQQSTLRLRLHQEIEQTYQIHLMMNKQMEVFQKQSLMFEAWHKNTLRQKEKQFNILQQKFEKQKTQMENSHREGILQTRRHYSSLIQRLNRHHSQKIKESTEKWLKLKKQNQILAGHRDITHRLFKKYKNLKTQWHQRIQRVMQKQNQNLLKYKQQQKEVQNRLKGEFENRIRGLAVQAQVKSQKMKKDHHQELLKKEAYFRQMITDIRKQHQNTLTTRQQALQLKLQNKEDLILSLNNEVENLNKNYIDYQETLEVKWDGRFTRWQKELNLEKQKELQQMEKKYHLMLEEKEDSLRHKWQEIKKQYDLKRKQKEEELEARIGELKEMHEDALHTLRVEMENDLIAEKRNSQALHHSHTEEVFKLQKEFKQLQAEGELKSFKIHSLQTQKASLLQEKDSLTRTHHKLQNQVTELENLCDRQKPHIEQYQKQVLSLQKLNRQLSEALQDQKTKPPARVTAKPPSVRGRNIPFILKDIHIHAPD